MGDVATESGWVRWVLLLPPVGMLADYGENLSAQAAVSAWPQQSDVVATVWMVAHGTKWLTLLPCFVLAIFALGRGVVRWRRGASAA